MIEASPVNIQTRRAFVSRHRARGIHHHHTAPALAARRSPVRHALRSCRPPGRWPPIDMAKEAVDTPSGSSTPRPSRPRRRRIGALSATQATAEAKTLATLAPARDGRGSTDLAAAGSRGVRDRRI
jgi:hypothetical protein